MTRTSLITINHVGNKGLQEMQHVTTAASLQGIPSKIKSHN